MANVVSGNSSYIDSVGTIKSSSINLVGVLLTATAANAQLVLSDPSGNTKKMDLRVATAGASQFFDFSASPVLFPAGVKALTVTNAIATLIYN